MFTHILCPTDLKERALLALEKAVQIAHQFNSKKGGSRLAPPESC